MPAAYPELINSGTSNVLLQNVVYALPAGVCFVTSAVAIESSMDGTTWTALTGANTTGVVSGHTFIRCPTANSLVVAKRYR